MFPVGLKLPGVFVLPKIAKGVEGGGDLSVRTLVCSTIAVGYWTLVGGSNTMKNNDSLSFGDGEPLVHRRGFGQDLSTRQIQDCSAEILS